MTKGWRGDLKHLVYFSGARVARVSLRIRARLPAPKPLDTKTSTLPEGLPKYVGTASS